MRFSIHKTPLNRGLQLEVQLQRYLHRTWATNLIEAGKTTELGAFRVISRSEEGFLRGWTQVLSY